MRELTKYFTQVEQELQIQYEQSRAVGNPLPQGQLRENFIETVLMRHLPSRTQVALNAQILDINDQRSQEQDIVLYRDDFPKIKMGNTPDLLLAESVIATFQVKSTLTRANFREDLNKVESVRSLARIDYGKASIWQFDPYQDRIKCYLVAYRGPKKMATLNKWVTDYFGDDSLIKTRCYDIAWVMGTGLHLLNDKFVFQSSSEAEFVTYRHDGAIAYLLAHITKTAARHPNIFP